MERVVRRMMRVRVSFRESLFCCVCILRKGGKSGVVEYNC